MKSPAITAASEAALREKPLQKKTVATVMLLLLLADNATSTNLMGDCKSFLLRIQNKNE